MPKEWDAVKQAQFIEAVQIRPILYDRSLAGYNTVLRRLTFKEVGDQFGFSEIEAEKKWKYLRDKYVRESKRSTQAAASSTDQKPDWELLPNFAFLEAHIVVFPKKAVKRKNGFLRCGHVMHFQSKLTRHF